MTASNPEKQTAANPQSGSQPRMRTASPAQRIFVKADKVVERPPVLFRMPTVAAADAAVADGIASTAPKTPTFTTEKPDKEAPQLAPNPESPVVSSRDDSAEAHHRVRAPHFLSKPAEDIRPAGRPFPATTSPTETPPPIEHVVPRSTPLQPTPQPLQTVTPESELERLAQKTPKSQRSQQLPDLPPLPEPPSRNWIDIIGSRVMIVLLVLTIVAFAIIANQDSKSTAELATTDLINGDNASNAPNPAALSNRTTSASKEPANHSRLQASNNDRSRRTVADSDTEKDPQPVTVEVVKPNFNLTDIDEDLPQTPVQANGELTRKKEQQPTPTAQTNSQDPPIVALTPPGLAPANTATTGSDWQDDLARLGKEMGELNPPRTDSTPTYEQQRSLSSDSQTNMTTVASKPQNRTAATNQPPLGSPASDVDHSLNRSGRINEPMPTAGQPMLSPPSSFDEPEFNASANISRDQESAIHAAMDAAVADRNAMQAGSDFGPPTSSRSNTGVFNDYEDQPEIIPTKQPAGIPDWTRYLPSNANQPGWNQSSPTFNGYVPNNQQPGYQQQSFGYPPANGQQPLGYPQVQPGMQQPGFQQPGMQQPGFQQPGMQQPGFQQPNYGQPGYPGNTQPNLQPQNFQQQNPGYQPNMMPPGLINSPSNQSGTGNYPRQAFTANPQYNQATNSVITPQGNTMGRDYQHYMSPQNTYQATNPSQVGSQTR